MKGMLVILFWCWVAVAFVIVMRRAVRKATGRTPTRVAAPVESVLPARATEAPDVIAPVVATPSPTASARTNDAPANDAPMNDAPRPAARPAATIPTIADALQGIRLPCDLMPLTAASVDFERRAAFVTVGYPADAVAPRVADEIERIGMAFSTLTADTAVAERDDVRVKIAVRSVGTAVNGNGDPVYPTAPEGSVVVEFELA